MSSLKQEAKDKLDVRLEKRQKQRERERQANNDRLKKRNQERKDEHKQIGTKEDDYDYDDGDNFLNLQKMLDEVIIHNQEMLRKLMTNDDELQNLIEATIVLLNRSNDGIKDRLQALEVIFIKMNKKWSAAVGPGTKLSPEMENKLDTVSNALMYISNILIVLENIDEVVLDEVEVAEVEIKNNKLRF